MPEEKQQNDTPLHAELAQVQPEGDLHLEYVADGFLVWSPVEDMERLCRESREAGHNEVAISVHAPPEMLLEVGSRVTKTALIALGKLPADALNKHYYGLVLVSRS